MPLFSFFFPDHFFEILYRHPPVAVSLRSCQPFNHMQTVALRGAAENEKPKRVAFFSLEMSRAQPPDGTDHRQTQEWTYRKSGSVFQKRLHEVCEFE